MARINKQQVIPAAFLLLACAGAVFVAWVLRSALVQAPPVEAAQAALNTAQPTASVTASPVPSPTVDWPATVAAANAERDTARAGESAAVADALNAAQVAHDAWTTAEAAGIAQAQIDLANRQLDAQETSVVLTIAAYTATAAPQMAELMDKILADREAERAHEAGELVRQQAFLQIEQSRKYGWTDALARILTPLALLVVGTALALAVSFNIAKDRADRERAAEAEAAEIIEPEHAPDPFQGYTPVLVQRRDYQHIADARLVPCSPEQLTEFSEGVLAGVKSTAIRQWEGAGTLWNRRTYTNFLGWMLRVEVGFATDRGTGTHALTAEGEAFLRAWMDSQALPHSFIFNPDATPSTVRDAHAREREWENGGGGGAGHGGVC